MPPFTVVKHFYIPKNVLAGLLPYHIAFMIKHLALYSAEERLRTGIIITVTFSAHASDHPVFLQSCLVFFTAVLHASIRVVNRSPGRVMPPYSVFQGFNAKLCSHVIICRPTHYFLGEYIFYGGQVQPAFIGVNVADIRYPYGSRAISLKVLI